MRRLPGLVKFPVWVITPLMLLGILWVTLGWAYNAVFWILSLVIGAVFALYVRRKQESITLEPWSKERGIVTWSYRTAQKPRVWPRLVWNDAQSTPTAPEAPPIPSTVAPAPEPSPTTPAADEAVQGRLLPFPPHPESGAGTVPAVAPESAAVAALTDAGRKICPDCAETVLSEARVCRYCGYRFEPAADSVKPGSE